MVTVLGYDIGGANTKAAYLRTSSGLITEFRTASEYFPFWKRNIEQLSTMLTTVKHTLAGSTKIDCVVVTLTAELSDVFRTKREGIDYILNCVSQVFDCTPIWVLDVDANLQTVDAAKTAPLKVASANWAATGWMVAQQIRNCVVVDVGSTSTSIIPIINGKIAAKGKTDLEKLIAGELIYTGSLRTNLAATVQTIPVKDNQARVSSELFAQSGDIHLILKHIHEEDYTSETADGKGKTRAEALARLARLVCADTDMLTEQELAEIAQYIYIKQVDQIADGLNQVYSNLESKAKTVVPVVVTGLGKDFLSRKAAEKVGITRIIDLGELMPKAVALVSPAVGAALIAATKLELKGLRWKQ
jgi:probable H4MPT-linked C1 transfer pathway protein